jgi:PIN domain nuclease of toxin-antitoxin system
MPTVLDTHTWMWWVNGDPADQIIVATSRSLSATLVTRDSRLRDYAHVRCVW